jgi:segregation and condensation protein B
MTPGGAPVTRAGLADILGRNISRDVIAALRGAELIATGPRSPQPGAPHTYVTTPAFLALRGLPSLRDLPDLDRLEEAGLLGKPPLPEELRGALGIRDDDEDLAIEAGRRRRRRRRIRGRGIVRGVRAR